MRGERSGDHPEKREEHAQQNQKQEYAEDAI
jgi:hypothetical protein